MGTVFLVVGDDSGVVGKALAFVGSDIALVG